MQTKNVAILLVVVALIVAAIAYLDMDRVVPTSGSIGEMEPITALSNAAIEPAKEISTPDGFINSPNPKGSSEPFTLAELIGKKVILLDIWTYSCINCQRTIPYLNAWHEKYKDKGLTIVGLHTPEFEFEKKYANVLAAVNKFAIKYPVVLDNDYSTWRAYRNQYWPRKYLIDIHGNIVYDHIGEGAYEETEGQIQKSLEARMAALGESGEIVVPLTREAAQDRAESPETYFGASRTANFGNGERGRVGTQSLTLPEEPRLNTLYLGGTWDIREQHAEHRDGTGAIIFRYKAKAVYFVASSDNGVRAEIYSDGVLQKGNSVVDCREKGYCGGEDVGMDGTVLIQEDRLYKLIQHDMLEEHVLRIEVDRPGLKAFTFTFG